MALNDVKLQVLAREVGATGSINDLEYRFYKEALDSGGEVPLVKSNGNLTLDIDNDNDTTTATFKITKDAQATDLFTVEESGDATLASGQMKLPDGTAGAPSLTFSSDANSGIYTAGDDDLRLVTGGIDRLRITNGEQVARSDQNISWGSTGVSSPDLKLSRDAANTLAQRNGTNAQAFNLYNTFTDASNYERLGIKYDTNVITFASEAAGTGTARNFQFTGGEVFIDQNSNNISLRIDSESTTADVIQVNNPTVTTEKVINLVNCNGLTSGKIVRAHSNSSSTVTRNLFEVQNANSLATAATPLALIQDAANQVMILDQNAASSFIDFQGTAAANTTDPISTLTTSGATTHHIQIEINGVKAWIAASTNAPS